MPPRPKGLAITLEEPKALEEVPLLGFTDMDSFVCGLSPNTDSPPSRIHLEATITASSTRMSLQHQDYFSVDDDTNQCIRSLLEPFVEATGDWLYLDASALMVSYTCGSVARGASLRGADWHTDYNSYDDFRAAFGSSTLAARGIKGILRGNIAERFMQHHDRSYVYSKFPALIKGRSLQEVPHKDLHMYVSSRNRPHASTYNPHSQPIWSSFIRLTTFALGTKPSLP